MPVAKNSCCYHDIASFCNVVSTQQKQSGFFSYYHLNAQSLRNKEEELDSFLSSVDYNFDVLAFCETWFSGDSDIVQFDGYNCEALCRKDRRGGGVALYVKNKFSYNVMPEYSVINPHFESLFITANVFTLGVIYRPPSGSLEEFHNFFEPMLEYFSSFKSPVIILGDLNINILNQTDSVRDFLDILSLNGFSNLIDVPTRITATSESLIDLCLTNLDKSDVNAGVLTTAISDHMSLYCLIPKHSVHRVKPIATSYSIRPITTSCINNFRQLVSSIDWGRIMQETDPNAIYGAFFDKIIGAYDRAFPTKIIKKSKKARKPWITNALLRRIKEKNKLFHKFIGNRDLRMLMEYKKIRNRLSSDIKKSRITYYANKFAEIYFDPQKTWRTIKDLLRKTRTAAPKEIKIDGQILTDNALANEFNRHFLTFGASEVTTCVDFETYIEHNLPQTLFLYPVTQVEIVGIINSLKSNVSCGFDGIKVAPIKAVSDLLCDVVCHLMNTILFTGIFPDKMKIAKVSVLHKGGALDCIYNYRPISVLPLFSKIAEKVINTRITQHLCKRNLITEYQYGFRQGKSTESALLSIREKIATNIENQLYTIGIFLDFNKAFDSIKHPILFAKLPYYGIRGVPLQLLHSYLTNRRQFVVINNLQSDTELINYGVPQGSILGPTLFLLYINDIVNIPLTSDIVLYADDTNVFFHV